MTRFYVTSVIAVAFLFSPAATAAVAAQADTSAVTTPHLDFSRYEERAPWVIPPKLAEKMAAAEAGATFDETKVRSYVLPDLFVLASGERVTSLSSWETQRRAEMLDAIRRTLYGYAPPKPDNLRFEVVDQDSRAMEGRATRKLVAVRIQFGAEPFLFHIKLLVPNRRTGPAPVFLLLNHRGPNATDLTRQTSNEFWPTEYLVGRGYAAAAINVSPEVEPDTPDATTGVRAYYRKNHPAPDGFTWGAISAWAWAGSRAADYLVADRDIDATRIAVIGHSRGGKTSLWAGAQDTRFALTCANDAGRSGPGIIRRDFARGIAGSTRRFPHWFSPLYRTYADRVDELPYDGHFMVALVAPRALHMGDASQDLGTDPRGTWISLRAGSAAWGLFGRAVSLPADIPLVNDPVVAGLVSYHMRDGGHGLTMFDWKLYLDHADLVFRAKSP